MTEQWYSPDAVFDGQHLVQNGHVLLGENSVLDIAPSLPQGAKSTRLSGTVTPGFVDLQVNGGGGVLFNATPSAEGIASIAAAHRRFGTVAIFPTVITDAPEVLAAAVDAALAARGQKGFAGLHIEGPHIDPVRRGTHAEEFIRPLDDTTIAHVEALRRAGIPTIITLAPEQASGAQISRLCQSGAIVSIGHSGGTAQAARDALAAGASCFTHLFNAMSPMTSRAAGMVGAAINSEAYVGMICDGIHVSDEMLALAIRARPVADHMFLVSDAMPTVGGPDHFDLYGQRISVQNGALVNASGNLAGAHISQREGVARLVKKLGSSIEMALRMAITVPAQLIALPELATLKGRAIDDVILLNANLDDHRLLADV